MNANLLAALKQIITQQGEEILNDPRRVSACFADLAKDEPKPQKNAIIKSLEYGFVQTLKTVPEPDRSQCKQQLAQKLHDEEGLDPVLCEDTVELLSALLFGEEKKKLYCQYCKKELHEEWKVCPYCSAQVLKESKLIISALFSGSGSKGYGIDLITSAATEKSIIKELTLGQNIIKTLMLICLWLLFYIILYNNYYGVDFFPNDSPSSDFFNLIIFHVIFCIITVFIGSSLCKHFIKINNKSNFLQQDIKVLTLKDILWSFAYLTFFSLLFTQLTIVFPHEGFFLKVMGGIFLLFGFFIYPHF